MSHAFGIDIGGSGIKGAPVDLAAGQFAADRYRIPTPEKSTPDAVAQVCEDLIAHFDLAPEVPVGITFPAPIKHGTVGFIANLDQSWKGVNVPELLTKRLGREVTAVNDADAAGYAEVRYGAAKDQDGLVIVTTLGTGIGSAFIFNGELMPNTELGHLELDGHVAEHRASAGVREANEWSFAKWAKKLQKYYAYVDKLFSPDLIVVGGGVSKYHEEFLPRISVRCPIVPAQLRNQAGIVGAAALAAEGYNG
ncbi:polyphosphate glucokinase [Bowdeniella nasicola]|uniref:Polyphosphate glucokinase n=1 Tax=Bowdeniella nasicola TaxID=208480 RepID=A0A1Q5Q350_9ACTO|nr:ROK family protein [Bowdeniella nasicola]OKL54246.1 polyphosphate glucokinase [Bowdeniella nasicola]